MLAIDAGIGLGELRPYGGAADGRSCRYSVGILQPKRKMVEVISQNAKWDTKSSSWPFMRKVLFHIAKWFSHIIFHWTFVYGPVKPAPISPRKLPQWARQQAPRCSLRIGQLEPLQPRQMVQFASPARYFNDESWWFVHIHSNYNIFISLLILKKYEKMGKQFSWDDVIKDSAACCALTCATCACVAAACHAPWMVSKIVCCKCASQRAMPTVHESALVQTCHLQAYPWRRFRTKKTLKSIDM